MYVAQCLLMSGWHMGRVLWRTHAAVLRHSHACVCMYSACLRVFNGFVCRDVLTCAMGCLVHRLDSSRVAQHAVNIDTVKTAQEQVAVMRQAAGELKKAQADVCTRMWRLYAGLYHVVIHIGSILSCVLLLQRHSSVSPP